MSPQTGQRPRWLGVACGLVGDGEDDALGGRRRSYSALTAPAGWELAEEWDGIVRRT